jgi:hypothetical protein
MITQSTSRGILHHGGMPCDPRLRVLQMLNGWRQQPEHHVRGNCRWMSCRKNTGYHATDPKIRTQGAERVRSRIAMKHGDESLESSNALHTAERDTELYPGSGPSPPSW